MKFIVSILFFGLLNYLSIAQRATPTLDYFLPETVKYNPAIPTPQSVLGYVPSDWHITHDQLVNYARTIAAASDRITLEEHGRSYENRPIVLLKITSPENHQRLEKIRADHEALGKGETVNLENLPAVIWLGYSIHGDEPSGSNAVPLVLYYLAAAQGDEIAKTLKNTVILLDPSYNPDGLQRFSTWVNTHKSLNSNVTYLHHREHQQEWPTGRTNHYWFDLNRDWILTQHPETQARVNKFQEWRPLILTDHHEMGSSQTFFFQPGVPSRKNPLITTKNVELTNRIADYHRAYLDRIGSLYFSEERFDDFYIGKGSTYPDLHGGIGILFEQGSAEGQAIDTPNGVLTFQLAVKNHFTTSLSTIAAANGLKKDLQTYRQSFFQNAKKQAKSDRTKAYIFGERWDRPRLHHFLEILLRHNIDIYKTTKNISASGKQFDQAYSYVVPLDQTQYWLTKGLFETQTTFQDSLFYDVSAWTLPFSFNIPYAKLNARTYQSSLLGEKIASAEFPKSNVADYSGTDKINYYLFTNDSYYTPRSVYRFLKENIIVKVATRPFAMGSGREFTYGTILVPVGNQEDKRTRIESIVKQIAEEDGVEVSAFSTGNSSRGIDLGSGSFISLRDPKVLLIVGRGVRAYEAGEVWHLLDQRYYMPTAMVQTDKLGSVDLSKFNTVIAVNGNYGSVPEEFVERLKMWLQNGGVFVASKSAVTWASTKQLITVSFDSPPSRNGRRYLPYKNYDADTGSEYIGGTIFSATIDITHPLGYGYRRSNLAVFRNHSTFLKKSRNLYANPLRYTESPLLSGYISKAKLPLVANSPVAQVSKQGKGRVIALVDNMNFRAYWYGTNKIFANAILFGHVIKSGASD